MKLKVCLFIILALIMVSEYGAICCFLDDDDDSGSSYPPNKPSNLVAISFSKYHLNLYWIDESNDEDKFTIERKAESGNYVIIAHTGANVESYVDTGLSSETLYYYQVKAYNHDGGYSRPSNEVAVMTFLNEPTSLTSTAISATQIDISWTDNSNKEAGFIIERKEGVAGAYAQVTTVLSGTTTYSDTVLASATIYYYRVKAYCTSASSVYSGETNATTY